jgi:microcystin-dependent protein
MDTPFLGSIVMFAGNFAPRGWALCNGQLLSIAQNTALFSILGTTYGGNGTTTFALPDLRGRAPVHPGQGPGLSPYSLGEQIGSETVTLLSNNMPAHNHVVNASTATSPNRGGTNPAGNLLAVTANAGSYSVDIYASGNPGTTMNPMMIGPAGGSQPFSILQPILCVNFIIALQGIFPSRN